jgi:hypothetical protein
MSRPIWLGGTQGILKRVWSCTILRSTGREAKLIYGALNGLKFDPGLWKWNEKEKMLKYITKQGRQMLKAGVSFYSMYLTCGSRSSHQISN